MPIIRVISQPREANGNLRLQIKHKLELQYAMNMTGTELNWTLFYFVTCNK